MCLCFYHTYTFSNRRAYIRLLWRLFNKRHSDIKYLKTSPIGWVNIVEEFGPSWFCFSDIKKELELNWDEFPIEDFKRMEYAGGFFKEIKYYQFNSWKTLRRVIREIGAAKYMYGKVTLKIH